MAIVSLSDWWSSTWSDLRLPQPPRQILDDLLGRHAEPHRAYHTAQHLEECCEKFGSSRSLACEPGAVQLALWFHDAVYDTRSGDNEERSAEWAVQVLDASGSSLALQDAVREMVLATRHSAAPESADAALTVDIDLSILGASPARFEEYEGQVRREYEWVPEAAYRPARAKILGEFLARTCIYTTDFFHDRYESQARENLRRSLDQLGARGSG
jgi:predicted metal-dependent HD superfamily phosphohydrolase